MNQDVILWIFGILIAMMGAVIVGFTGWAFAMSQRVTVLETTLKMLGKTAAEILHSPHTPELDAALEKYLHTYQDRHFELSREEWKDLQRRCQEIINDRELGKGERLLAGIVIEVTKHKLELPDISK